MNLSLVFEDEMSLDALYRSRTGHAGNAAAAGQSPRPRRRHLPVRPDAVERNRVVSPGPRYARFEPITVRAAARVLRLQRAGVVSAREAGFYLRELAAMDAHAGRGAFRSLVRAAR